MKSNKIAVLVLAVTLFAVIAVSSFLLGSYKEKEANKHSTKALLKEYRQMEIPDKYSMLGLTNKEDVAAVIRLEDSNYMVAITRMGFPVIVGLNKTGKMVIIEDIIAKQQTIAAMIQQSDFEELQKELEEKQDPPTGN